MPLFQYKAKRFDGKTITGVIELEDDLTLIDRLHQKKAVLLSVKELENNKAIPKARSLEKLQKKLKKIFNRVTYSEILLFTHQLTAMFGAGVPLSRCFESLSRDLKNKKLQDIVSDINRDIESGDDLSEALAKHPHVFNKLYINMVHAGEASGTLSLILSQLAFYMQNTMHIRGKLKAALTYPLVLISFALMITLGMLIFIIPQFSQMYSRLNTSLPLPTRIMMNISTSIQHGYLLYVIIFFGLSLFLWILLQTNRGQYFWDKMKLRIPIFGTLIFKGIFIQFSRTLSILVKSGLPIIQSIKIVSESISNTYIEKKIEACSLKIQRGATISEAFSESKIFPELMIQMISSGEESGTLSSMLAKIADFYQEQIDTAVATLSSLIEPILIVVIGLIVGSMAISIFLPIFKMGGAFH